MGGTVRIGIQQKETKITKIGSQKSEISSQQAGLCFLRCLLCCSYFFVIARRQQMTEEVAAEEEDDAGCPA